VSRFKVGDKRLDGSGDIQEILAVEMIGTHAYYWVKDHGRGVVTTLAHLYTANGGDFAKLDEIPEPFFEEGKNYVDKHNGQVITVLAVREVRSSGRVAMAETSRGIAMILYSYDLKDFRLA